MLPNDRLGGESRFLNLFTVALVAEVSPLLLLFDVVLNSEAGDNPEMDGVFFIMKYSPKATPTTATDAAEIMRQVYFPFLTPQHTFLPLELLLLLPRISETASPVLFSFTSSYDILPRLLITSY